MAGSGLTTARSWDEIWGGSERPRYHGLRSRLRSQVAWTDLLRRILDVPARDAEVLELGCAPGSMIEQLHGMRPGHRYRGIDISRTGLELARQRLAARGIEADLRFGDMRDAEVPQADLVVSFGLVEHFTDPAEALRYHRRLVKAGGHVAVTVPNYSHPVVVRAMEWFSPETLATHNLRIMSTSALREALGAVGFTEVEVGESGGPTLPSSRPRPGLAGTGYRFVARAWNVGSTVLPEKWPWSTHLWAVGRVDR